MCLHCNLIGALRLPVRCIQCKHVALSVHLEIAESRDHRLTAILARCSDRCTATDVAFPRSKLPTCVIGLGWGSRATVRRQAPFLHLHFCSAPTARTNTFLTSYHCRPERNCKHVWRRLFPDAAQRPLPTHWRYVTGPSRHQQLCSQPTPQPPQALKY